MRQILMALALTCSACSHEGFSLNRTYDESRWTHADSDKSFSRADYECNMDAHATGHGLQAYGGSYWVYCMKARGWKYE